MLSFANGTIPSKMKPGKSAYSRYRSASPRKTKLDVAAIIIKVINAEKSHTTWKVSKMRMFLDARHHMADMREKRGTVNFRKAIAYELS